MKIMTVTLNPCIDKTVTLRDFRIGAVNRAERVSAVLAGKGINVSRVLEASGDETVATGFMGEGGAAPGICGKFVGVPGNIRTNIKLFDAESRITTEINEGGFEVSADKIAEFSVLYDRLLDECGIAVISGSMPRGVSADFYKKMISAANKKGVKTVFDASGESFALGMEAHPYAVKPNIFELEEYLGETLDSEEKIIAAAQGICASGVRLAAISLGKDGAVFCAGGETIRVKPFEADVKSTVGAGDSMVAAIAHSIKNGFDLYRSATLAAAMGTLTAELEGTAFTSFSEAEKRRGKLIADIL